MKTTTTNHTVLSIIIAASLVVLALALTTHVAAVPTAPDHLPQHPLTFNNAQSFWDYVRGF